MKSISTFSHFVKRFYEFISSPFRDNFSFFMLLFLLASSANLVIRTYYFSITSGILWCMYGFIESYLLCLVLPFLKNKYLSKCYRGLLLILGAVNFLTDVVIGFISPNGFRAYVGLILGTNIHEALEFFKHYITINLVVYILLGILALVLICKLLSRIRLNEILIGICMFGCVFCTIGVFKSTYNHSGDIFLGKIVSFVDEYKRTNHDLRDFYSHPSLESEKNYPANIVVVVGESFSRDFSSLYGYDKETNPLLAQISDSSLVLFNNVTSGQLRTVESFQLIMSLFSSREKDKNWYECTTLQEIMSELGYKSYWISNQAEVGAFENVLTQYANLCDSTQFVGGHFGLFDQLAYDEAVLSPLKGVLEEKSDKNKIIFVHLNGSHPAYEDRYPSSFNVFKSEDYLDYKENQRGARAFYDNSLVYNDWLMNEIFKMAEKTESICFYFSDHGLDLFHTKDDYSGHARIGIKESEDYAKKIPFMVYASQMYQAQFPEVMQRLYASRENEFVTEDFIYLLLDVLGVKFTDNNDVREYSCLTAL